MVIDPKKCIKNAKYVYQDLRIVVWANIPALGYDKCSIVDRLLMDLVHKLCDKKFEVDGYKAEKVKLIRFNGWADTIIKAFRKFNYGDKHALFLYPYDVGSIDIRVCWWVDPNCLDEDFECLEPIECVRFD